MRTKVAAVVFNSVFRDARVLKQAESMEKNNYEVKVFGIQDENNKIRNPKTNYQFDIILSECHSYRKFLLCGILTLFFVFIFHKIPDHAGFLKGIVIVFFLFAFLFLFKKKNK
ncbi:hypothetical protein A7E78_01545 [Syntrophotalea acetylenivorans]|uniref:Uncharacterized protein n=1 Tax=Syntrophotalea acetylenivorans TaxID=1842532 RepID=A0A1L3GL49_9BACT|nr:hypothetical protein [Syntrophotalea acetylenivorans]APG26659.1 hypothetical protein A7E78_01545 [Syntrophotalea acetylenivorans]